MYSTTYWVLIQNKNSKNPSSELHLSFRSFDLKARSLYHFKIWYSVFLEKYWLETYMSYDQFLWCILFNATLKLLWSKKRKQFKIHWKQNQTSTEHVLQLCWSMLICTCINYRISFKINIWTTDILHTHLHTYERKKTCVSY